MGASRYVGRVGGLAVALGMSAAAFSGQGVAWAAPDSGSVDSAGSPTTSGAAPDSGTSAAADSTAGSGSAARRSPSAEADDAASPPHPDTATRSKPAAPAPNGFQPGAESPRNHHRRDSSASHSTTDPAAVTDEQPQDGPEIGKDAPDTAATSTTHARAKTTAQAQTHAQEETAEAGAPAQVAMPPVTAPPSQLDVPAQVSNLVADVGDVLAPLAGSNPEAPADSPVAWALLAAARREFFTATEDFTSAAEASVPPTELVPHMLVDTSAGDVSVNIPPMPVTEGASFAVSPDFMAGFADDYVAAGKDPSDSARFFFGDLAVASLEALSADDITPEQTRLLLGNLAASGYFGGIWLRDNLRESDTVPATDGSTGAAAPAGAAPFDITSILDLRPSAIAIHLFDALATSLTFVADYTGGWLVAPAAHVSIPLLLALYGYNRGYLEVVLENPPEGVPSMQDTLTCAGFLGCTSTAFPLELATRYDDALAKLAAPTNAGWLEMAVWTTVLEGATSAGRFVWELGLAQSGAFSPVSYGALVELSSAYLMVSKAAVLSSMIAYADGDTQIGRSSLRLQAGLWIWSGTYFGGLASDAVEGTLPTIVVPG